jgi:NDP-sugar pyrophosphorylase family protein
VIFNAVKIANKYNNTAHVYSGMAIIKSKLITQKIKNFKNFEIDLYPKIIKKIYVNFKRFSGFWYSIDNNKDIKLLKTDIDKKIQNK